MCYLHNVLICDENTDKEGFHPLTGETFKDPTIAVAILDSFQKLRYDCPTQDKAQVVSSFVLEGNVFCDTTKWKWQVTPLCLTSLYR